MAALPSQGCSLPPADNPCQGFQEAEHCRSDPTPPWWGQGSRLVLAPGPAQDGAVVQPAHAESPGWGQQAHPAAGLSVATLEPQHRSSAQASSFLEELFSATAMEEDTHPWATGHLRQEEPPGSLEAPLSEDEFLALLDMLHDSTWPQA